MIKNNVICVQKPYTKSNKFKTSFLLQSFHKVYQKLYPLTIPYPKTL